MIKISKADVIWLLAGVLLIVTVFTIDYLENKEIDKNLGTTTGIVIKVYRVKLSTWYLYEYYVVGKKYKQDESASEPKGMKDCYHNGGCIGKKYIVEYSTKNPQHSRIRLDKPIVDSTDVQP